MTTPLKRGGLHCMFKEFNVEGATVLRLLAQRDLNNAA